MAIESLDPKAAHAAMQSDGAHVFLDVRTVEEYEAGHPEGSVNVPWAVRDARGGMVPNPDFVSVVRKHYPSDATLFVSCQAGHRSLNACRDLEQAGYTRLVNVDGGFGGRRNPVGMLVVPGWVASRLPVASERSTYSELVGA